ncbi:MAG: hypothetical protein ACK4ZX_03455 [Thermus sp.]
MKRVRQYVEDLLAGEEEARLRTTLEVARGKLISWAVQLEWWDPEEERWVWVVRYDTAGGRGHRDRNRIAAHEAVPLPGDPGQALKWAQADLRQQAQRYIEEYRAAKAPGGEEK